MKLFLTLALTAISTVSLFAASIPRADVSGKIELEPVIVKGQLKVAHPGWGKKETRTLRLTAAASKPIGETWTLCKFSFTPKTTGSVHLSIGGQWAKNVTDRGWMAISGLKVNGKLVENGDFAKTYDRKGKTFPVKFWLSQKATYVAKGGPDGAGAVIVNHDNRVQYNLKVEAGKPVTIEYMAKATEPVK